MTLQEYLKLADYTLMASEIIKEEVTFDFKTLETILEQVYEKGTMIGFYAGYDQGYEAAMDISHE